MSALWAENRKSPPPPRRLSRDRRRGDEAAKLRRVRGTSAVLLVVR